MTATPPSPISVCGVTFFRLGGTASPRSCDLQHPCRGTVARSQLSEQGVTHPQLPLRTAAAGVMRLGMKPRIVPGQPAVEVDGPPSLGIGSRSRSLRPCIDLSPLEGRGRGDPLVVAPTCLPNACPICP